MIPECYIKKEKEILGNLIEANKDKTVFFNYLKELESVVIKSDEYERFRAEYNSKNDPIFYKNAFVVSKLQLANVIGLMVWLVFDFLYKNETLNGYFYAAFVFVYILSVLVGLNYLSKIGEENDKIIKTDIGFFHTYQTNLKEIKTKIDNLILSLNKEEHDNLLREIKNNKIDNLYCFEEIKGSVVWMN